MGHRHPQPDRARRDLAATGVPQPRARHRRLRVLCGYGFAVRGLHRLQLETLADNTAMVQAATASASPRKASCAARRGPMEDSPTKSFLGCSRPSGTQRPTTEGRSPAEDAAELHESGSSWPVKGRLSPAQKGATRARSSSARSRREAPNSAPSCTNRRTHIDGTVARPAPRCRDR